jgi:ABC-2 type transport system ATP-binding protein
MDSLTMDSITALIARLRLAEDNDNYADAYSRGMKNKLGLLLAMLHDPKLLVLDEPTNGLDVESVHLFYDRFRESCARHYGPFFKPSHGPLQALGPTPPWVR